MLSYLNRFLDSNIDITDLNNIIPLSKIDSLLFGDCFFSDTIRYATLIGRSYGEPIMSKILDESEIDASSMKIILESMYPVDTIIYFFWDINSSVKTTWGLLTKYWDNFCYSGDDSIIYVNLNEVYLYTDMILRRINQTKNDIHTLSNSSLQALGNEEERKALAILKLIEGFSDDIQEEIYTIFHAISESIRTFDKSDELRIEYIARYKHIINLLMKDTLIVCRPYDSNSQRSLSDFLSHSSEMNKVLVDSFFDLLREQLK